MYEADVVKKVSLVYLQYDYDCIMIMITDFKRALMDKLYEGDSETFLLTFGELLLELYKTKYEAFVREINKVREEIERCKARGWDAKSEEQKLKMLEEHASKYASKIDALENALRIFKDACESA